MKLGAGVVQGRDAQEHVVVVDAVVLLLHLRCLGQAPVLVEDGLGEAGGAGGEVDGTVVLVVDGHGGIHGRAVGDHAAVVGGIGGHLALLAHKEEIRDGRQIR